LGNSDAGTSRGRPSVAVVGAGVSGCAAALALARVGVHVVLLNSALDSLGLPGYGPVVDYSRFVGPEGVDEGSRGPGFAHMLRTVAPGVAGAWLAHAWDCEGGATMALVDRRAVSLAVKWRIENEPLIDIRQGIVTGIEEPHPGASKGRGVGALGLTTAFGEQVVADAVVVAVGLAFGGRVRVGAQESTGGRLGETGAEELLECLRRRNVSFDQVGVGVGSSFSVPAERDSGRRGRASQRPRFPDLSGLGLSQVEFVPTEDGRSDEQDGRTERSMLVPPPSPYDDSRAGLVALAWTSGRPLAAVRAADLALVPDGVATGEWYAPSGVGREVPVDLVLGSEVGETRPAYRVSGFVATEGEGELLPGVWVIGRAAGARGYMESLASGWRIGRRLATRLGVESS